MRRLKLVLCIVTTSLGLLHNVVLADDWENRPRGFNTYLSSIVEIQNKGEDDDLVLLQGRLTNFLGEDNYEFTDIKGDRIEVELDDDIDWSQVHRDQLITIFGKVDKNMFTMKIDAKDYSIVTDMSAANLDTNGNSTVQAAQVAQVAPLARTQANSNAQDSAAYTLDVAADDDVFSAADSVLAAEIKSTPSVGGNAASIGTQVGNTQDSSSYPSSSSDKLLSADLYDIVVDPQFKEANQQLDYILATTTARLHETDNAAVASAEAGVNNLLTSEQVVPAASATTAATARSTAQAQATAVATRSAQGPQSVGNSRNSLQNSNYNFKSESYYIQSYSMDGFEYAESAKQVQISPATQRIYHGEENANLPLVIDNTVTDLQYKLKVMHHNGSFDQP